jgi:Cu/Ag efflux pump CusA
MRRLAAPMIGGLTASLLKELRIYPVIFYIAKSIAHRRTWRRSVRDHRVPARATV